MLGLLWGSWSQAEVDLPEALSPDPVQITAEAGNRWIEGSSEVWVLRGHCRIQQGSSTAQAQEAVVWINGPDVAPGQARRVIAYLEQNVSVALPQGSAAVRVTDKQWLGRFHTTSNIQVQAGQVAGQPDVTPEVYQRAMKLREPAPMPPVRRTQFIAPQPVAPQPKQSGERRIRVFPRGETPAQFRWDHDPNTQEWIARIDSGGNIIVDGVEQAGVIDVVTDRVVIWTSGMEEPDLSGQRMQSQELPLEVYLEGNVVFRQANRVIYAERMYYNFRLHTGTVLNAELLTPVPSYAGLLRLRSEVLQQTGPNDFYARNSYFTSSRMGLPGYRLQVGDAHFQMGQQAVTDPFTGAPAVDPVTGEPVSIPRRQATANNTFLFVEDLPVFYWPRISTSLEDPTFYIQRARVRNDDVFGTQLLTDWNLYDLLGVRNKPDGTNWDLSLDYMSKRGLGHGTTFLYDRQGMFDLPGRYSGIFDYWGIYDDGIDNLGSDRRAVPLEQHYRYRLFWQHRQELPSDYRLTAEVGWISDRNFLEEYYEREWDELKDQTTGVELKRSLDSMSWSVTVDGRLNRFLTQTESLPRFDLYMLGQSVLQDSLTLYGHTSLSYSRLQVASQPENPVDHAKFGYLPWEVDAEGERLITRHELDWPFQLGPVKFVPYVLGELGHWGQDLTGEDLQRVYGQAGMRASLPFWRVNPDVENPLWNVHGLAHKVTFEAEFLIADSNRSLDQLPLYEQLDDDNIEAFRRRFAFNTFGFPTVAPGAAAPTLSIPRQFDERYYALRSGLASWVTSSSMEVADDLALFRLGMEQRWQTKRGMPGQRHIVDWVVFDTHLSLFPNADRDNYGETAGLWDYNFRWHVGDRLSLVSDGIFDFFEDGQKIVNVGAFLARPPRGSLFLGFSLLEGPIRAHVISGSYSYWMSPKWMSSFGMSVDLAEGGSVGQNFVLTRIGESFLISAGFNVDDTRGSVGVNLAIEPRFLSKGRLGNAGGARVPVAGAYGLE